MKGRPPTPKHILELRNSKHAKNREELGDIMDELPPPPDWISQRAQDKFTEVCGFMVSMGTLAQSDVEVITRYSVIWDRWRSSEEYLAKGADSYVEILNPDGSLKFVRPSKWQAQSNNCHEQLRQLETVLGLTPADRTRMGYKAVKKVVDPVEAVLGKRDIG
jgi:P27 family predicted phage terminase small subunit